MKETLRYALPMECGVQSVTAAGAMLMLSWPAGNLATQTLVRFHLYFQLIRSDKINYIAMIMFQLQCHITAANLVTGFSQWSLGG